MLLDVGDKIEYTNSSETLSVINVVIKDLDVLYYIKDSSGVTITFTGEEVYQRVYTWKSWRIVKRNVGRKYSDCCCSGYDLFWFGCRCGYVVPKKQPIIGIDVD